MGWVVNATPRPLYPREWPGTYCIGGWVGPRAGLDECENFAPPGYDPRSVQSVASRYTEYAIPGILSSTPLNRYQILRCRYIQYYNTNILCRHDLKALYVQELKNKSYHLLVAQCQLSAESFT
jgi:hypothetical protein